MIFYNEEKGYGFVRPDDGGGDVFAHAKELLDVSTLRIGQRVEFDAVFDRDRGKYRAQRVTVIG